MTEAASARCPVMQFDHESPAYARAWTAQDPASRPGCPVVWNEHHGGFWFATSYEDIVRISRDPDVFTNGKEFDPATGKVTGGLAIPPVPAPRVIPDETDGEEWRNYRKLINKAFTPKQAEAQRAQAQRFAAALLDARIETGTIDMVQDLTSPLPALISMELLGFELSEWRDFADPLHELMYLVKSSPEYPACIEKLGRMSASIRQTIAARRAAPRQDLISHLATSSIDGVPLDDETIRQIIVNLLYGGVDTTTALTANVLIYLSRHPAERQRLIDNLDMLPLACEEFIRYFAPIHGVGRNVQQNVTVGGQDMTPGDRVFLAFAHANRDEAVFPSPNEVILDRYPNPHIGFGVGNHRCIGSFLARMMFEVMLREVLTRMPDYVVDEAASEPYGSISSVNGWINVPARFTPGPRTGEQGLVPGT